MNDRIIYTLPTAFTSSTACDHDSAVSTTFEFKIEFKRLPSHATVQLGAVMKRYAWNRRASANDNLIRRAYRRLVLQWHPDKNTDPEAAATFLKFVEAYEVLGDNELRQQCDQGDDVNKAARERTSEATFNKEYYEDADETSWSSSATKKERKPLPKHCCIKWRAALNSVTLS